MLGEVTLQSKLFAASVAAEGLDVAVSLHVGPQVALVRETLAALTTVVWLLSYLYHLFAWMFRYFPDLTG